MKITTGSLKLHKNKFYANFVLTFCKIRKRSPPNRAKYVTQAEDRNLIPTNFSAFYNIGEVGRVFSHRIRRNFTFSCIIHPWRYLLIPYRLIINLIKTNLGNLWSRAYFIIWFMTLLLVNILNPEHANIKNPSARPFDLAIITFSSPKYTQRDIKRPYAWKLNF